MASLTNVCRRKTAKRAISLTVCPGTIAQAEALDKAGIVFDAVINLEISDEEILPAG